MEDSKFHIGTELDGLFSSSSDSSSSGVDVATILMQRQFNTPDIFPDLAERADIYADGTASILGIFSDDLAAPADTSVTITKTLATINVVESGAGYNNSLGAYTVAADGTIKAVELAYDNVKTPLADARQVEKLERNISRFESRIENERSAIEKIENRIEELETRKTDIQSKIDTLRAEIEASSGNTSKLERKISSYEKQAERIDSSIERQESQIEQRLEKIDAFNSEVNAIKAKISELEIGQEFTYEASSEEGSEIGFFIIANGDRLNGFDNLDLQGGELHFIYNFGQADERLANISDSAANISLVHIDGDVKTVLKGNIFHTTEDGASTAINPDGHVHAVSGLAVEGDPSTLRIGFEDLKNLGDADFNDLVIDVKITAVGVPVPENEDPVAADDSFTAMAGNILQGNLLEDNGNGQDTDPDGDTIVVITATVTTAAGAQVVILENGDFTYTPVSGYVGADSFTYSISDGNDGTATGTATVTLIVSSNEFLGSEETNDVLMGSVHNESLYGLGGDDLIYSSAGRDLLDGGTGIDTVDFSSAVQGVDVTLSGNYARNDGFGNSENLYRFENVVGSDHADFIAGNDAANTLLGGAGDDDLRGAGGDDVLQGGLGSDRIDGGDGIDTADYSDATQGIDVSLAAGFVRNDGHGNSEIIRNIENVTGGLFNDTLIGNDGANTLRGGGGNDLLRGFGGDDVLYGGTGVDRYEGGAGIDTIDFSDAAGDVNVTLAGNYVRNDGHGNSEVAVDVENVVGGAFNDTLAGSEGANALYGSDGDDFLFGHGGDDLLVGGAGKDRYDGGDGIDTIDFSDAAGGVNVTLAGNYVRNDGHGNAETVVNVENVTGSEFNDTLIGDDLGNELRGGAGNDYLYGHGGSDTLYGGAGNDHLYGGAGADVFVFEADTLGSFDMIRDFNAAEGDAIDLSDILSGFDSAIHDIGDFVSIAVKGDGDDTNLYVDIDGAGTQHSSIIIGQVQNVGDFGSVEQMIANGQLIV